MAGESEASAGTDLLTSGVSFLSDSIEVGVLTTMDCEVRELCDQWQGKCPPASRVPQIRTHSRGLACGATMASMKHLAALLVLIGASTLRAEEITLATYNVELFDHHFMAHHASTQPIAKDPAAKEILEELRKKNDEDNWETAQVILDPKFSPDILVMEEACDEGDLKYFNHQWLHDAYE